MSIDNKIKYPELLDDVKQNGLNPTTFHIPSKEELEVLTIGSTVKVSAAGERFWATIEKISDDGIIGKIDNDLIRGHEHNLFFDDLIAFKLKNIINIY